MDIVILYQDMGMTPTEVVEQFPSVTLSDVHSALAYYYDHPDEVRNDIDQNAGVAEQLRSRFPSVTPPPVNE